MQIRLPFEDITPEEFERLGRDLAAHVYGLPSELYGASGGSEDGADFVLRAGAMIEVAGQAKRVRELPPRKLEAAVDLLLAGRPGQQAHTLLIMTSASMRNLGRQAERERQSRRAVAYGKQLHVWDDERLFDELRRQPELVERYFGRDMALAFCGHAPFSERPLDLLTDAVVV
jgi:hypothetical protein